MHDSRVPVNLDRYRVGLRDDYMYASRVKMTNSGRSNLINAFLASPFRSTKLQNYFPIYEKLLANYVGREITLVEIGVLDAGSLFMWREYLGPKARIIGIDANPDANKWREHGFEIYVGDQGDPRFWKEIISHLGEIDVLIDDGGHTNQTQIVTLVYGSLIVRNGGLLIVEDTHTSFHSDFGNPSRYSFMQFSFRICEGLINYGKNRAQRTVVSDRIASVEFFPSLVAFRVDRREAMTKSEAIENSGVFDSTADYRNLTRGRVSNVAFQLIGFLENPPVVGQSRRHLRIINSITQGRIRKLFLKGIAKPIRTLTFFALKGMNLKMKRYFEDNPEIY